MSGSGGNVGAQAGDSNPDMNRTTSAENNAKEKDGKVSTTRNNIYSNEAYFAHVISQCVQFVIVLSRDRNLGRADELTGYDKSRVFFKCDILSNFQTL